MVWKLKIVMYRANTVACGLLSPLDLQIEPLESPQRGRVPSQLEDQPQASGQLKSIEDL